MFVIDTDTHISMRLICLILSKLGQQMMNALIVCQSLP